MLQLTLYDLNNRDAQSGTASLLAEFTGYEGFLSSGRFISDESIVTGTLTKFTLNLIFKRKIS